MTAIERVPADRQAHYVSTLERLLALPATNVKSTLDQVSQLVTEVFAADKVDAFVYEPAIDTLVAVGTSHTPMGRRQHQLGLNRMPLANGGSSVEVFKTGVPYRTGHADQDPRELRGTIDGLGVRSILAVALDVDSLRRGVIQVDAAHVDHFSADDLALLQGIARWTGMVLHRAELAERIRSDAADQARRVVADEFVTILAHDLRGPLTPLVGYLALIRQEAEQHGLIASVRYATACQRVTDRLLAMIGNLLDTARLEQGLFDLDRQVVDLTRLARETAVVLATADMPIQVRGPEEVLLNADPERIRQLLENLLSNARAHSPQGAEILVEVAQEQRADGTWAVLMVHDAGPGIAPELLPNLFKRFVRGASSRGLGLGLYLTRGIAEAHGGTLTVDSTSEQGTTFRLSLPASNGISM